MSATYAMGVDFGSTTGKTVILDARGATVAETVAQRGSVSSDSVQESIAAALNTAGITQADVGYCVSTGYGRRMLDIADGSFTEITCHARGAWALSPGTKLVIDIGGQDSKVISLDEHGMVSRFAMNDRCAAGTGKFLEVLARATEVELEEMGPLALTAGEDLTISSMCATFAETEVVALLAEGRDRADILGGVHASIAHRTVGMVSRVGGKRTPAVMTGGVAKNPAAVAHLERALQLELYIPPDPQIAGALGAALLALDELRSRTAIAEDAEPGEEITGDHRPACQTGCGTNPGPQLIRDITWKTA